jgi:hypothetical protein
MGKSTESREIEMKSLKKIVGELVLATACGTAVGVAVGHSVETYRKESYDAEKEKNPHLFICKYEMNRRFIYGTGALGGILAVVVYMKRGNESEPEEKDNGDGSGGKNGRST